MPTGVYTRTLEHRKKMWRGVNSYEAAHLRLSKTLRIPKDKCVLCQSTERLEYALKKDRSETRTNPSGSHAGMPYSTNPADYMILCIFCHKRHDRSVE